MAVKKRMDQIRNILKSYVSNPQTKFPDTFATLCILPYYLLHLFRCTLLFHTLLFRKGQQPLLAWQDVPGLTLTAQLENRT